MARIKKSDLEKRISELESRVRWTSNLYISDPNSGRGAKEVAVNEVLYALIRYLGLNLVWDEPLPGLLVQKQTPKEKP